MKNTQFMGILNLTPDSFSDGGRFEQEDLVEVALQMVKDGATILDMGGESTGPGSEDVSLEEELKRVVPAVKLVREALDAAGKYDVKISVDTWKSEVAEAAIQAGAEMVNDVTAGRGDKRMFEVVASAGVPICLMYSKDATARTSTEVVDYEDVMQTVKGFLQERVEAAKAAGLKEIIVDPGMGMFVSADSDYSWEIIERIEELDELACPVLVGASRKSFLGEDRFGGTLLTTQMLSGRVDILRVHDVFENVTQTNVI